MLVRKTLLFTNQGITQFGVMRAFDKATGAVVWEQPIDTSPRGGPMTYLHEGKAVSGAGCGGRGQPAGATGLRSAVTYALA